MTERFASVLERGCYFAGTLVPYLPLNMPALCRMLHIRLVPLSQMLRDGFDAGTVFGIWGNRDGTSLLCRGQAAITYNDTMPKRRVRFTLAEETMHIYLGHLEDPRFNIATQDFDEALYAQYEHEAKTAAGMILCPPKFYFAYEDDLSAYAIAELCQVSEACAARIIQDYRENGDAIKSTYPYRRSLLPAFHRRQLHQYRDIRKAENIEML